MNRLAIIIPAYNEELTIERTIGEYHNEFPEAHFYIIDNNSKDTTYEITKRIYKSLGLKGKILQEPRQGKGFAVRYAISNILAEHYIIVDADCTYKASDARILLNTLKENGADIVTGDRHCNGCYQRENKRLFHNFGNMLIRRLINFLFRSDLNDILTGLRVFNNNFAKNYPILSEGFEIETEMTLHILDKNFKILEVPIDYCDRPEGSVSKLNTYKDGLKLVLIIFHIFRYYKPLLFFSIISAILFLFALYPGIIVISEYYATGQILHIPSAILATGLMICSTISFAIGIILDGLVRLNRENFEMQKIKGKYI